MKCFEGSSVLIAGGEGFIGQHLVRKLCAQQARVVSLGSKERVDKKAYKYISVDIRNKNALAELLKGYDFDYVFNLSGYIDHGLYSENGRDIVDVHFTGLMNLLDQVNKPQLKCFVQVGSSDEYGGASSPQNEGMREAPISPYSAAKVSATHLLQTMTRSESFPGVIVRPFLSYGPGQKYNRLIPQVIKSCLNNMDFPTSEGKQLRDFCYVEDLVEGILLAATTKAALGEVFNIASGKAVSVREVIEIITNVASGGKPKWGAIKYRPGENMKLYADISKAKSILGWEPTTSLHDGILKTVKFYKEIEGVNTCS